MRELKAIEFLCLLSSIVAGAKEKAAVTNYDSFKVQVFVPGPDVTFPELIPIDGSMTPPEGCNQNLDGKVALSLLVDTAGRPRNVMFLRPLANDLDRYALKVADVDRFRPGIRDGAPVTIAVTLEIEIKSCVAETIDSAGKKNPSRFVRSIPGQQLAPPLNPPEYAILPPPETFQHAAPIDSSKTGRFESGVTSPVLINQVEIEEGPRNEVKNAKYQGVSIISLIVDAEGMPQNAHVVRDLGMGLDRKAIEAVSRYRFKPALKDGVPVPAMMTLEVNFRLY